MALKGFSSDARSAQGAPLSPSPYFPRGLNRGRQRGAGTGTWGCSWVQVVDLGPGQWWPSQCPAAERPSSAVRAGKLQVLLVPLGWQGQADLNLFTKIRLLSQLLTCFSSLSSLLCLHASHTSCHNLFPPHFPFSLPAFRGKGRWQHLLSYLITCQQNLLQKNQKWQWLCQAQNPTKSPKSRCLHISRVR